MAYRDDLDALTEQRAREDDQLRRLADFTHAERRRRRRSFATWFAAIALSIAAVAGLPRLGTGRRKGWEARLAPPVIDASRARRDCMTRAVHHYLREVERTDSADGVAAVEPPFPDLDQCDRGPAPPTPGR